MEIKGLDTKTISELNALQNDDLELSKFIKSQDISSQYDNIKRDISSNNVNLAESNMTKADLVAELKSNYQDLLKEFQGLTKSMQTPVKEDAQYEISQCVMLKYHSLNAESERLVTIFQRGEISFEEFVQAYKSCRLRFHTSSYIHEKLASLLSPAR